MLMFEKVGDRGGTLGLMVTSRLKKQRLDKFCAAQKANSISYSSYSHTQPSNPIQPSND